MAAVYVSNLSIQQGVNFSQAFTLADTATDNALNLTGYAHSAQLRKHFAATTSTPFQTAVDTPTNGIISVSMGSSLTSQLKPGRYVYDLVIVDGSGVKTRAVEGTVLVRGGVTR
jgi:hypothetical protein